MTINIGRGQVKKRTHFKRLFEHRNLRIWLRPLILRQSNFLTHSRIGLTLRGDQQLKEIFKLKKILALLKNKMIYQEEYRM